MKLHVAIVASPGLGHLTFVLLLGNRLATHHNIFVTVIVVTTCLSPAESKSLLPSTAPKLLNIVQVPHVDISGLIDANTKVVTCLSIMMRETRPRIRSAISAMNHRPDALIMDLFGSELFPIAEEFCMPRMIFMTSTAMFVALTTYCQVLDKEIQCEYVDCKEPLKIPCCRPVHPKIVVDPMLDRSDQQYREYIRHGVEYSMPDQILMNTWEDLEPTTIDALRNDEILQTVVKVPVYPIGPLSTPVKPVSQKSELIFWLDVQPSDSVMYVSFGSGGTMAAECVMELAMGLELSQQRFIWVVRPPMESHADGTFFTAGNGPDGTPAYLPERFLTRTHKLGNVVPLWMPCMETLNHPSVGMFLSHCCWNSNLESISNCVNWVPLYNEQRLNATLLTEDLCVAWRPTVLPAKKVVEREEIEKNVRNVMQYREEGKGRWERVKFVKCSCDFALSKGGSSYNSLAKLFEEIMRRLKKLIN
nr:ginsenoside compound K glucosyltransferase [Panax ginseng]